MRSRSLLLGLSVFSRTIDFARSLRPAWSPRPRTSSSARRFRSCPPRCPSLRRRRGLALPLRTKGERLFKLGRKRVEPTCKAKLFCGFCWHKSLSGRIQLRYIGIGYDDLARVSYFNRLRGRWVRFLFFRSLLDGRRRHAGIDGDRSVFLRWLSSSIRRRRNTSSSDVEAVLFRGLGLKYVVHRAWSGVADRRFVCSVLCVVQTEEMANALPLNTLDDMNAIGCRHVSVHVEQVALQAE